MIDGYPRLRSEWSRSDSFVIDEWEISPRSVHFLDVEIFKGPDVAISRRLQWAPRWKPTSLGVPLGENTCHPRSVQGWMRAELGRLAKNSSDHHLFVEAKNTFILRLARFRISEGTLAELSSRDPFAHMLVRQALQRSREVQDEPPE